MSKADGGSRQTNQTNSVTTAQPRNSPNSDTPSDELPTPRECLAEFVEKYGDRAELPVTEINGTSLRADYADEQTRSYYAEAPRPQDDDVTGTEVVDHTPVTWGAALYRLLKDHLENRQTKINLTRAWPGHPEHAEFAVDAETRWFASYQKKYFAQMNGWLREVCGGQRPSGGVTDPEFDNPRIALVTLSASATPDGDHVGPVDHVNALRESWSDVYDTARNTMRSKGLEWQYDRRSEPHTSKRGGGANACYTHDHIVMVVDGEVSASDFRPLVEKHVESCEWAGVKAHDLDVADWDAAPSASECDCSNGCSECVGTVTVREPDDLENVAAYVADYCSIDPVDLLERSPEHQAWAAAMTAGNVRTVTRSDAANWAATADSCRQRAESDQSDQTNDHGAELRQSDRRGCSIECAECGSPHGIDQDQTLSAARLQGDGAAVADGGLDVDQQRRDDLAERWPSARAAAQKGETARRAERREKVAQALAERPDASTPQILGRAGLPPDCAPLVREEREGIDRDNVVSVSGVPGWRVESITVGQTEYPASSGGGVDLVEASGLHDDHLDRLNVLFTEGVRYRCACGVAVDAHATGGIAGHLTTHGITDPGEAASLVERDDLERRQPAKDGHDDHREESPTCGLPTR